MSKSFRLHPVGLLPAVSRESLIFRLFSKNQSTSPVCAHDPVIRGFIKPGNSRLAVRSFESSYSNSRSDFPPFLPRNVDTDSNMGEGRVIGCKLNVAYTLDDVGKLIGVF